MSLSLLPFTSVCSHSDQWACDSICISSLALLFGDQTASVYFCLECRFTKDGILVEGLFWKDVEALIVQYTKEPKKSK